MITTEEEAKAKLCHRMVAGGMKGTGLGLAGCAGSKCMAWRWYDQGRGYCGLAGLPAELMHGRASGGGTS